MIYVWGKCTKIYFNLQNVYGETFVFVRRIICSIDKILEVTDFKINR